MNNITSGCPAGINTQQYVSAEISPCRINACYDGKLIMKTTDSAVIHALRITATIVIMRLNTPNFFLLFAIDCKTLTHHFDNYHIATNV